MLLDVEHELVVLQIKLPDRRNTCVVRSADAREFLEALSVDFVLLKHRVLVLAVAHVQKVLRRDQDAANRLGCLFVSQFLRELLLDALFGPPQGCVVLIPVGIDVLGLHLLEIAHVYGRQAISLARAGADVVGEHIKVLKILFIIWGVHH